MNKIEWENLKSELCFGRVRKTQLSNTDLLQSSVGLLSSHSDNTKYQRDLFIRKLSDTSKTLHFARDVVNLNGVRSLRQDSKGFALLFDPSGYKKGLKGTRLQEPSEIKTLFGHVRVASQKRRVAFALVRAQARTRAKLLERKKRSILSFDLKSHQFLFANNNFYRLNVYRKLGYLYGTDLDKMSFLSSDLSNLALSLKTYTLLKRKGIHKIGSLVTYSPKALLQLLNRNREMFAEVKRCLLLIAVCGNE